MFGTNCLAITFFRLNTFGDPDAGGDKLTGGGIGFGFGIDAQDGFGAGTAQHQPGAVSDVAWLWRTRWRDKGDGL